MGFKMDFAPVIAGTEKLKDELEEAAGETVDKSTDVLMFESQIQVPREHGTLAASARKTHRDMSGPTRSMGVKYGEGALNSNGESYAAAVHEILKASHALPTKAKYVEDPLVEGIKRYKSIAIMACEKAVGRSF